MVVKRKVMNPFLKKEDIGRRAERNTTTETRVTDWTRVNQVEWAPTTLSVMKFFAFRTCLPFVDAA